MKDRFEYTSPYGFFGRLADILFLKSYMERFLRTRAELIRVAAEAGQSLDGKLPIRMSQEIRAAVFCNAIS